VLLINLQMPPKMLLQHFPNRNVLPSDKNRFFGLTSGLSEGREALPNHTLLYDQLHCLPCDTFSISMIIKITSV